MSRGFVREEDQEEIPIVPPRADLPEGVTNYVTQTGLNLLLEEKQALIASIGKLETTNENEKRIAVNFINAKLSLLNGRIASAKKIDVSTQPKNEIRFGALVTLKVGAGKRLQRYQIVGVDEADISKGKISFISPIARILMNKTVGELATLNLAKERRVFEVVDINYKT